MPCGGTVNRALVVGVRAQAMTTAHVGEPERGPARAAAEPPLRASRRSFFISQKKSQRAFENSIAGQRFDHACTMPATCTPNGERDMTGGTPRAELDPPIGTGPWPIPVASGGEGTGQTDTGGRSWPLQSRYRGLHDDRDSISRGARWLLDASSLGRRGATRGRERRKTGIRPTSWARRRTEFGRGSPLGVY